MRARSRLSALAERIAPLGWHIQIYASISVLAAIAPSLAELLVPVVLDHYAMAKASHGAGQPDLAPVLQAVGDGHAYVKLSAPYRISQQAPDYLDVQAIARAYIDANPDRILWASDWPHTNRIAGRAAHDVTPFKDIDDRAVLRAFRSWVNDSALQEKIFTRNPARLYRF